MSGQRLSQLAKTLTSRRDRWMLVLAQIFMRHAVCRFDLWRQVCRRYGSSAVGEVLNLLLMLGSGKSMQKASSQENTTRTYNRVSVLNPEQH